MLSLGISFSKTNHINVKARNRVTNAVGSHEDLLTTVKRRVLMWHGHTARSRGLAKIIQHRNLQVKGKRGRKRKRWEDNFTEVDRKGEGQRTE